MSLPATLMAYLARRFLGSVLIVFSALVALTLSIDLADLFARSAEKDIPTTAVIAMSFLKLPDIAQKLIPFAVLLGAVLAFSKLSRSQELVASRAAGVSAWQFLMPPLAVAIAMGLVTMTLFSPLSAALLSEYTRLEARYLRGQDSQLAISPTGLWLRQGDGSGQAVIHALHVTEQGVHLEDVTIFLYRGVDEFVGRIDAGSADLTNGRWRMRDAFVSAGSGQPDHHDSYELSTGLTPSQIQESFASPDTISFWDLPRFIATAEGAGFSALRHRVYWYSLLALPVLFAAMVLMAASFSFRLTRLGGISTLVLAASLSGIGVFFLGEMSRALGQSGILPTPLAAVAPAAVAILIGMTLLFHEEDG